MEKETIGTVLVVWNEGEYFPYVIESLLSHLDQVVILDNLSTDITQTYLKKIQDEENCDVIWNEDKSMEYPDLLNSGLGRLKTKWYLMVDCDEVYYEEPLSNLSQTLADCKALADCPDDVVGFRMKFRIFIQGHKNCVGIHNGFRLVLREGLVWSSAARDQGLEVFAHHNGVDCRDIKAETLGDIYYCHFNWCLTPRNFYKKRRRIMESSLSAENKLELLNSLFDLNAQFMYDPFWEFEGGFDRRLLPESLKGASSTSRFGTGRKYVPRNVGSVCTLDNKSCPFFVDMRVGKGYCSNLIKKAEGCARQ